MIVLTPGSGVKVLSPGGRRVPRHDFDRLMDRRGTCSLKWDGMDRFFARGDRLPLWVADMDFPSPPAVVEALMQRAAHPVFGYTQRPAAFYESVAGWIGRRYGWSIPAGWIIGAPGVVPSVAVAVLAYTDPGDGILIQPPVYFPFRTTIETLGRRVVENPLKLADGRYTMDYRDLREAAARSRLAILCSPHNPVGRVWTRDELHGFGSIMLRSGVIVLSDEIHADIVFSPHRFVPYGSLGSRFAGESLTCHAVSKTFNLAGLRTSTVVIPGRRYRERFQEILAGMGLHGTGSFGIPAVIAAYDDCEEWLADLGVYLWANYMYLRRFVEERIPEIRILDLEGTYLAWMDCSGLGLGDRELAAFMLEEAGLALDEGTLFGTGGEGFMRLNFACPRSILETALGQLESAVSGRRSRSPGRGGPGARPEPGSPDRHC
jgi:cystathionine beta-lyase